MPVEGRKRGQLEALLDQFFDGDVDEVRRIVHRGGGLRDGLGGDSPGLVSESHYPQALAYSIPVAPERALGYCCRVGGRCVRPLIR